jgi:putative oxygen-independent coproporphyrinogen III oxidase
MSIAKSPESELLERMPEGRPLGVYIHFPWCLSKCPYCDFFSVATQSVIPHQAYADAVISEFDRRFRAIEPAAIKSLYLGGGTPSLWEADALGRVISHILDAFGVASADIEVTLECNPSSFGQGICREWRDNGVNRLSLGLQSLNDTDLKYLGRAHDAREGLAALEMALGSGMPRVCADLIFGLPGRMPSDAVAEVKRLPLDALSHLSVYALTIEPNTPFGALARAGRLALAPEDFVVDSFVALHEQLSTANFEHYEISNYARHANRSVHNMGYWQGHDYLGLGVAAFGTVLVDSSQSFAPEAGERLRYRNTTRIQHYFEMCSGERSEQLWQMQPAGVLSDCELIDPAIGLSERLMLGLRTRDGIDLNELCQEFDINSWLKRRQPAIERLVRQGRLNQDGATLTIPFSSWFLADGTISELI